VEDRVGEDLIGAQDAVLTTERAVLRLEGGGVDRGVGTGDDADQGGDVLVGGGLADGDADVGLVDEAQVEALVAGGSDDRGSIGDLDGDGVEEEVGRQSQALTGEAHGQGDGTAVDLGGDGAQAGRAVPDGVEAGDDGKQCLGGADVRGRLVAADVLLTGLQGEAVGRGAVGVDGDTDDAARHLALVLGTAGQEGGVRATEEQRDTEALGGTHGDIGTGLARGLNEDLGQQVGGDGDQTATVVDGGDDLREIGAELTGGGRVGDHGADDLAVEGGHGGGVHGGDDHGDVGGGGAGEGDVEAGIVQRLVQ